MQQCLPLGVHEMKNTLNIQLQYAERKKLIMRKYSLLQCDFSLCVLYSHVLISSVERSQGNPYYFFKSMVTMSTVTPPIPQNNRLLRLIIIHIHTKFEDDPTRTAAGRAITRKSLLFL